MRFKDIARTIDYLETRHDIDTSKLGYTGVSLGSQAGLIALGAEPRFKAAVLVSIGSSSPRSPEVDTWNYAPRIKVPVLMLNGHDDSLFVVETSQNPLFKALGTPEKDKRHIIYPGLEPIGSPGNWRCVVLEKLRAVEQRILTGLDHE